MSVPPPPAPWGRPPAGLGAPAAQGWYGHPGYPPPGYPPPGYPPPPGHSAPSRATNGFAIAALVLGIIGFLLITIPLSVVFGCIGLSQIRRTGQTGRGMAIAGLVLAGVWVVLIVGATVTSAVNRADRDGSGTITAGGSVSATSLRVGDCIAKLKDVTIVTSLPAVPCSTAHAGEVFAVFDLPAGPYPGEAAVDREVQRTCNARLDTYAPSTIGDAGVGLYVVYPLDRNWQAGDREVVCLATSTSGSTVGSISGR